MTPLRVAVVGGGISGLACALKILELKTTEDVKLEVLVFESSKRFGGTIETEHRDGFILEKGPDSFITDKTQGVELSHRLGLEPEIISTQTQNRRSFVMRKGKLVPLPPGFYILAPVKIGEFLRSPLFSLTGKARMLAECFIPKKSMDSDESVAQFVRRRFGKETLDRVGQAMLAGIYAGDPESLSMHATMPRFLDLEKKYGSVIRGLTEKYDPRREKLIDLSGPRYSLFASYKNGMETLVKALTNKLPWASLHLQSPVKAIAFDAVTGKWKLSSSDEYMVDAICLAQSAKSSSELLKNVAPSLSKKLSEITTEPVATVNMAYEKKDVSHALDGFGYVAPRIEKRPVFACSFTSQKFAHRAPADTALFRAFVGGAFGKEIFQKDDAEIESLVQKEMASVLGIKGKPRFCVVGRYPDAMVQYNVGHEARLAKIDEELAKLGGIFLTGSSYRGVGIPDCIREAELTADEAYQYAFEKVKRDAEVALYSKIWKMN